MVRFVEPVGPVRSRLMFHAPPPDILTILPPPESPPSLWYTTSSADAGVTEASISPVKASRSRRLQKRKRTQAPTSILDEGTELVDVQPFEKNVQLGSNTILHLSDSVGQIQTTTSMPTGQGTYQAYLEYVLADCAGFYQISSRLCVVQGWDSKKKRVTVSETVTLNNNYNPRVFRNIGTIFSLRGLGPLCR
jgi:hypothetical protein